MSIVIIHGWSDDAESFRKLQAFLTQKLGVLPVSINLADWVSMDDTVTYADLAVAMNRAWDLHGLSREPRSVDILVHSTGALVTREWMTTYYRDAPDKVPIRRFVMLAPANFGSPLAHKGHSFIGRAFKGWDQPDFQTGKRILKGLELASPYTYALAMRDLFNPNAVWYGRGKILATVLVGNTGYSGLEAIANEKGSDGTVRISTANLNCTKLTAKLDKNQQLISGSLKLENNRGDIAIGIIDGENHSTVAFKSKGPKNPATSELIVQALNVSDADYPSSTNKAFPWQQRIDQLAPSSDSNSVRFQNTVTWLHDDLGQEICDYFVEFYRKTGQDKIFEAKFYRSVIDTVHAYDDLKSYRSLYLDINALDKMTKQIEELYVGITAMPVFGAPGVLVGYRTLPVDATGGVRVSAAKLPLFFQPHRTLLIDLMLTREVSDQVFTIKA